MTPPRAGFFLCINNYMTDNITNFNYLSPTGFKVVVGRENYKHLQYFAQSVQHPGLEVQGIEVPYKRTNVSFTGNFIQNSTLTMDILIDENMESYKEMYDWMLRMVNEEHELVSPRGAIVPSSYADITVSILTSANNPNRFIKYRNAFPTSLGDIQFAATSTGEYIVFPVSFKFDYFEFS